jgi:hypothetical protein
MSGAIIECLSGGVGGETQYLTATNASEAGGVGDQDESKGPHVEDSVGGGAFLGATLAPGDTRAELKRSQQVVGEDAELLPGTIGRVVIGRDDARRRDRS